MEPEQLKALLEGVQSGDLDVDQAIQRLASWPQHDLGHSRIDTHRDVRCGFPEVVFGAGKTPEELIDISHSILSHHDRLLVTRAGPEGTLALQNELPEAQSWARAGAVTVGMPPPKERTGNVMILSAGTADGSAAEEALVTARMLGAKADLLADVGVAGLHRLLGELDQIRQARVLVVVAGMEGALPSVVGGLVDRPVIAVPTSVGYGASFGGIAALLGMLNSCAAGVTVVNIDNGFGAGYAAALINRLPSPPE